jgi:hypothetical protein
MNGSHTIVVHLVHESSIETYREFDCCRQFTCACFGDWAGGSSVHCQISSIVPLSITSL